MHKFGIVFSMLIVMFLASCTKIIKYEGDNKGFLVYSQAATAETDYGAYWLHVRSKNGEEALLGYLQNNIFSSEKRDFYDSESNGIVRIQSMPPGEYNIFKFAVSKQGEGFPAPRSKEVSIPFTIKSNEITYIGEFLATDIVREVILGLTSSVGVTITVNDRQNRDVSIINKRQNIKEVRINRQISDIRGTNVE